MHGVRAVNSLCVYVVSVHDSLTVCVYEWMVCVHVLCVRHSLHVYLFSDYGQSLGADLRA